MARLSSLRTRCATVATLSTLVATMVTPALAVAAPVVPAMVFAPQSVNFRANSSNWAGWVAAGHHTAVAASWRQPSVTCSAHETSDSAFWVGLDGYGSRSVEQVGTQSGCSNGYAFYSAWTEFYPAPASSVAATVRPGDTMRATVTFVSGHTYRLTLSNSTRSWTKSLTGTSRLATNASVEVVVEAPSDAATGRILKLSRFAATRFTSVTVDHASLSRLAHRQQLVMGSTQRVMAQPSVVSSSASFAVSWRAAAG